MRLDVKGLWLALMTIVLSRRRLLGFHEARSKAGGRMEGSKGDPLVQLLGGAQGRNVSSASIVLPLSPSTVRSAAHHPAIMSTPASIVVAKPPVRVGKGAAMTTTRRPSPMPIPVTPRHVTLPGPATPSNVNVPPANASMAIALSVSSVQAFDTCPAISRAFYRDTCPVPWRMVEPSTALIPINPAGLRTAVGDMEHATYAAEATTAVALDVPSVQTFTTCPAISRAFYRDTCPVPWRMVEPSTALIPINQTDIRSAVGDMEYATCAAEATTAIAPYVPNVQAFDTCPAISRAIYRNTCPSGLNLSTAVIPFNPADIRLPVGDVEYGVRAAEATMAIAPYVPNVQAFDSCPAISRAIYRNTCPSMLELSTALVPFAPAGLRAAVGDMEYGVCVIIEAASKAVTVALPASAKQLMAVSPVTLPPMTVPPSTSLVVSSKALVSINPSDNHTAVGDTEYATWAIEGASMALITTLPAAAKQLMPIHPVLLRPMAAAPIILGPPITPPASVCKALILVERIVVMSPPWPIKMAPVALLPHPMVVWSFTGEAPGDVTPDVSDDVSLPVGVTHEYTTVERKEGEPVQLMVAVHADLLHERLQGSASEGEVCRALHPWVGDMCAWRGDDVAQDVGQSDPQVAPEVPTTADDGCVEELGEDSSLVSLTGAGAGEGQGCGAERAAWTCADVFKWLAGLFLIVLGVVTVRRQVGDRHEVQVEDGPGESSGSGRARSSTRAKGLLSGPTGAGDSFDEPPPAPLNTTAQASGSGGVMILSEATPNPTRCAFLKPFIVTSPQGVPTSGSAPKRLVLHSTSGPTPAELHTATLLRHVASPYASLLTWPRASADASPLPLRLEAGLSRLSRLSAMLEPLASDGGYECIAALSLAPRMDCPAMLLLCVGPSSVRIALYRHAVSRAFSPTSAKNGHLRSIPSVKANGVHRFVLTLDCVVEGEGKVYQGLKARREGLRQVAGRACRIVQAVHEGGEAAVTQLFGAEKILSARLLTPSEQVAYTDALGIVVQALQTFVDRSDVLFAEKSELRFLYTAALLQKGK